MFLFFLLEGEEGIEVKKLLFALFCLFVFFIVLFTVNGINRMKNEIELHNNSISNIVEELDTIKSRIMIRNIKNIRRIGQ